MTSEMSYIGTENYNESKHTEEKILTISKIANSQDVGMELVTRSQDLQTNYKMNMQMANIKVVKRLIEVLQSYAVQHSVPARLELPDRNEQCRHRRSELTT